MKHVLRRPLQSEGGRRPEASSPSVKAIPQSRGQPSDVPALLHPPAPTRRPVERIVRVLERADFDHRVQFYEKDEFLYDVIAAFFAEGAAVDEPLVVIADEGHRDGLCARLERDQHDVALLRSTRQLILLDAEQTLASFMVGDMPDAARFATAIRGLTDQLQASSGSGRIRAYGEMVDLLWRSGNAEATVALEQLWNELGRNGRLSLLCGYRIGGFDQGDHAQALGQLCDVHGEVSPTETYPAQADSDERRREVVLLQQRALVLEREVEHRKRLEKVLQDALLQRRRVEDELRASQQELKAMEQELRRQNEDLSRTVRFSELFVGILGHDLRNPLSAIATAASLLRRRADCEKVSQPADRIINSTARMGRMIDQLLDFTRIRLGEGIPIEQQRTDLGAICRLAVDEVEASGALSAVELKLSGDVVGWWDADRLLQLVSNLLSNAVVHGRAPGAVKMSVDAREDQRVILDIHNTGVVSQALMPLLFEPFRSGSDTKMAGSQALGLGLFISQQIAHAHSGNIDVTSSDAEGTRFTVTLPRAPRGLQPVLTSAGQRG